MTPKPQIIINQTILPAYRLPLFDQLLRTYGASLEITAGEEGAGGKIHSAKHIPFKYLKIKNHYLLSYKLWWQTLPWVSVVSVPLLITEANMRIVSTWCVLILRRLLGKKTLLWGHLRGANDKRLLARRWFLRLGNGFMAYTDSQKEEFAKLFPTMPAWSVKNALYNLSELPEDVSLIAEPGHFVYVGRLIPEKEPRLMIDSFLKARQDGAISPTVKLIIIGTGTLEGDLREAYAQASNVEFMGECNDLKVLADIYAQCLLSLSAGAVGLAAVQSFCFGVPMIIADGLHHGPEIEACKSGVNCEFFEPNNVQALANRMTEFVRDRELWIDRRASIAQRCREQYSLEAMVNSFAQAIEHFLPELKTRVVSNHTVN